MIRLSHGSILGISAIIGIASNVIPPLSAPGMLAALLVVREGVHSSQASVVIVLAVGINFCLTAALSYWILTRRFSKTADSKVTANEPVEGIIYTESEIEEFKRRGLM